MTQQRDLAWPEPGMFSKAWGWLSSVLDGESPGMSFPGSGHSLGMAELSPCWRIPRDDFAWTRTLPAHVVGDKISIPTPALPLAEERERLSGYLGSSWPQPQLITLSGFSQDPGASCWPFLAAIVSLPPFHPPGFT